MLQKSHLDENSGKMVVETFYDPEETILANAEQRANGRVMVGSKGQQMLHVASIPLEHVQALINQGYNLLSADPQEVKRAMLYIQANERAWMTVDGNPIAKVHQKWV